MVSENILAEKNRQMSRNTLHSYTAVSALVETRTLPVDIYVIGPEMSLSAATPARRFIYKARQVLPLKIKWRQAATPSNS